MDGGWLLASLIVAIGLALIVLGLSNVGRARAWLGGPASRTWETELRVVFSAATKMALEDGAEQVDTVHFLLAASASPDVAAALERSGSSVAELRSQLAPVRAAQAGGAARDLPRVIASSPALVEGLRHSVRVTRRTGEGEVLLVHVLDGLSRSGEEATRLLRDHQVAVREGAFMVTFSDDTPPPTMIHLWNDPVSKMEGVVELLRHAFGKSEIDALYVMFSVHLRGHAALGPFDPSEVDLLVEKARGHAQDLGMDKLRIGRSPPDTTGWRMTDSGLLP